MKCDLGDHFNNYYFRDSFDHSSSDLQLIENSFKGYDIQKSHRSSRSQTPLDQGVDNALCVQSGTFYNSSTKITYSSREFSVIKVFIPSLIFVLLFVTSLIIIMLETDCELFGSLRNIPEILSLRYHYYKPWKQYFLKNISSFFRNYI